MNAPEPEPVDDAAVAAAIRRDKYIAIGALVLAVAFLTYAEVTIRRAAARLAARDAALKAREEALDVAVAANAAPNGKAPAPDDAPAPVAAAKPDVKGAEDGNASH